MSRSTPLRCISLWQPWASAIALGLKQYETRSWQTPYRGWVAIHAAKRWGLDERAAWRMLGDKAPVPVPLGVVVALACLKHCWRTEDVLPQISIAEYQWGDYGPGRYAWQLEDIHPLATPLPLKGRQGMWWLTPDEAAEVWRRAHAKG